MNVFSPREIISELNRFIIGQEEAKRAVAIALRNRWRRLQVDEPMRREILPKNILMIGPTGVGKTEIARRLSILDDAPFVKAEATKFTEVGYVGRDVEQIVRDLVEVSLNQTRGKMRRSVEAPARLDAEKRIVNALVKGNDGTNPETWVRRLRAGELDDHVIEVQVRDSSPSSLPTFEIPGAPGAQMGMVNLNEMLGKMLSGGQKRKKRLTVGEARDMLLREECDRRLDEDKMNRDALQLAQERGIVFLDEIDKICTSHSAHAGANVSREGVQRDLLPLIEGTIVATRHGQVNTEHILFIASGAFHQARPADLMPELQGRLPVRVRLKALLRADFVRILTEPENNLVRQYQALLEAEKVKLTVTGDAIEEIAALAAELNERVENIGARRLHAIMEKTLEDISFDAGEKPYAEYVVDRAYVRERVKEAADEKDLARFIL